MKILKRIIGIAIIIALFGLLFISIAIEISIGGALKVFGLALAVILFIAIALWLIIDP